METRFCCEEKFAFAVQLFCMTNQSNSQCSQYLKGHGSSAQSLNEWMKFIGMVLMMAYLRLVLVGFYLLYRVSQKKLPAFERLLLPEYIINDILQYLIK